MTTEQLPRHLGPYRLTAALGEDALGHEYRAVRETDGGFVRLRALDAPELSADAVLDAIQQNGSIHEFLKNPAIARGVDMDAADGVPYIAWNEINGRTLKNLLQKSRTPPRKIPVEHSLLIAEKVATALDHAYNTTIDGDRTLHGLVWPGFIAISDDGEIRLTGFGLAPGVLPALNRPHLTREVASYLAPEERDQQYIGKNSDVFSVGAILLELLTGQPPGTDPLAVLKGTAGNPAPAMLPEIQAVLRMTLGPPESRYGSSGDLRRELGKLLFSGPYSPSTFNLAYFLNDIFKDEIEAEGRARKRESSTGAPAAPGQSERRPPVSRPPAPAAPTSPPAAQARPAAASGPVFASLPPPSRRSPLRWAALGIGALILGGAIWTFSRPSAIRSALVAAPKASPPAPTATFLPEFMETPAAPTNSMSDAQFQEEVSRRLALEVPKLEAQMRARSERAPDSGAAASKPSAAPAPTSAPLPVLSPIASAAEPTPAPTPAPAVAERIVPTAPPAPTRVEAREETLATAEEADTPPRIAKIVKPSYPPLALRARIGGIVVLRVQVSEAGAPLQVEVVRGSPGGLTEAAVDAVRKWTFEPARKGGVPMRAWMVVPIPFEP
jgi:TonB family protein